MPRVLVPLADGFEEMEGVIIIDVLRRAGVEVVAAGLHAGPIVASRRTRHLPDALLDEVLDQDFDMIVLPGGAQGAKNLEAHAGLAAKLKQYASSGKPLAAICAAPNVFRNHGIIHGEDPFTLHPGTISEGRGGAYRPDARIVRTRNLTTSQGPGTAFEFALELVEQLCGKETRSKVAGPMILPPGV